MLNKAICCSVDINCEADNNTWLGPDGRLTLCFSCLDLPSFRKAHIIIIIALVILLINDAA